MSDALQALARSTTEVLAREAQRNEARVSVVRMASYGLVMLSDLVLAVLGLRAWEGILQSGAVVLLTIGIFVLVIRMRYRPILRLVIPLVDAALIYTLINARIIEHGVSAQIMTTAGVASALFASTGGVRFNRTSAVWTTLLSEVLLVMLLGPHINSPTLIYSLCAVAGIGFLAWWQTDAVRRAMRAERGRLFLSRFLPGDVVDRAFQDPMSVLAAPRAVDATILVTDIRGFTALAERMEPAQVLALLNRLQGALAEAVQESGGVVDKFMGDGMLAVFGAPQPLPDHADRAMACVKRIRAALEGFNASQPEPQRLKIGMGVHSGTVVAGCMGSGDRLEFTVLGDTVNTTSRLESLTKEHGVDVLVSAETVRRAAHADAREVAEVTLRGRTQPLRVFTLPPA